MADVARLAGVSTSTVSYVLSGARPISGATRERIERAMVELGYTPNVFARGLKSKRSKIIALLFPKYGRNLSLSSLEYIFSASDYAQEQGYHLLLWTTDADALDDLARLVGAGLVDGVLVMEVRLLDPRVDMLRRSGLTFAMIGRNEDPIGIDFADTDFDQCARVTLGYLTGLGHRHLGFVNLDAAALTSGRGNAVRLQDAILRAAGVAGVSVLPVACPSSVVGGREAFNDLVRRDQDLSAVIAFNEPALPGIIAAALEFGWRVPDELSILTIDMPPAAALMTTPAMTTVGPSAVGMGRAAVDMLIRRLEGGEPPVRQQLFEGELQVRNSSALARTSSP